MTKKRATRFRYAAIVEGTVFVIAILLIGSLAAMPSYSQQAGEIQTIIGLNCMSPVSAPYIIDSIGSCMVQVSGINTSSNATGIVTFSANSSSVSFPEGDSCTLVFQSCSLNYTVSSPGAILISAKYQGDGSNSPSSSTYTVPEGNYSLIVAAPNGESQSNYNISIYLNGKQSSPIIGTVKAGQTVAYTITTTGNSINVHEHNLQGWLSVIERPLVIVAIVAAAIILISGSLLVWKRGRK